MADFESAYKKMQKNEGGWVNDPADPGQETYCGISRKWYPDLRMWEVVDQKKKEAGFPKNLAENRELAELKKEFYKKEYWQKLRADEIKSDLTAFNLFDYAVNAGIITAVKLAQTIIKVEDDGKIGKNTLSALNDIDEDTFLTSFCLCVIVRYHALCLRNQSLKKFFFGWVSRTLERLI